MPQTAAPYVSARSDALPPAVLTVPETAALLRVSISQVYRLAERRELPGAAKVGSQWRVSRSQLLAGLGLTEAAA